MGQKDPLSSYGAAQLHVHCLKFIKILQNWEVDINGFAVLRVMAMTSFFNIWPLLLQLPKFNTCKIAKTPYGCSEPEFKLGIRRILISLKDEVHKVLKCLKSLFSSLVTYYMYFQWCRLHKTNKVGCNYRTISEITEQSHNGF